MKDILVGAAILVSLTAGVFACGIVAGLLINYVLP